LKHINYKKNQQPTYSNKISSNENGKKSKFTIPEEKNLSPKIEDTKIQYVSKTYVKPFFERKPLNNNIESNQKIFSLNYNRHNFTCSFNLNTSNISPLKFNNPLKENIHMLNETSQNINNIEKIKINEKTYSYSKKEEESTNITTNKFTQTLKNKSKDKHIVKYKKEIEDIAKHVRYSCRKLCFVFQIQY
jgi:hypothetical protein